MSINSIRHGTYYYGDDIPNVRAINVQYVIDVDKSDDKYFEILIPAISMTDTFKVEKPNNDKNLNNQDYQDQVIGSYITKVVQNMQKSGNNSDELEYRLGNWSCSRKQENTNMQYNYVCIMFYNKNRSYIITEYNGDTPDRIIAGVVTNISKWTRSVLDIDIKLYSAIDYESVKKFVNKWNIQDMEFLTYINRNIPICDYYNSRLNKLMMIKTEEYGNIILAFGPFSIQYKNLECLVFVESKLFDTEAITQLQSSLYQ